MFGDVGKWFTKVLAPYSGGILETVMTLLIFGAHTVVVVLSGMELAEAGIIPVRRGWPVLCSILPLGYFCTMTVYYVILRDKPSHPKADIIIPKFAGMLRSFVLFGALTALVELADSKDMLVGDTLVLPEGVAISLFMSVVASFKVIVAVTLVFSVEVLATHARQPLDRFRDFEPVRTLES